MSKLSVVRPTANGKKPLAKSAPKPSLTDLADDLYGLRSLLKKSMEAERKLTSEVLEGMRRVGVDRIEGAVGVAIIGTRTALKVDPGLFVEAIGPVKAYLAMTVSVTAAREFMGEQDLEAISEVTVGPVLRTEPKPEVAR